MRLVLNFGIISPFQPLVIIVHRTIHVSLLLSASVSLFSFAQAESVVVTDWQPWANLPEREKSMLAPVCPGSFVAQPSTGAFEETAFRFNKALSKPEQETVFTGDVSVRTDKILATTDQLIYDQTNKQANLHGNVSLRVPSLALSSQKADISLEGYYALLKDAQFVLHGQDIHGAADIITRQDEANIVAERLSFTRCAPSSNAWQLKSAKLTIDTDEQVARAWHSRLEIQTIPVLYIPYISFPLNGQARTGFLIPTFGSGFSQPYYLHLAPNYDDTITVDVTNGAGTLLRNEFRFLTANHNGINDVSYRVLEPTGNQDTTAPRWSIDHQQSGQLASIGYDLSTRWISDQNFDLQFNNQPGATKNQTLNLELATILAQEKQSLQFGYTQPVEDSISGDHTLSSLNSTLASNWAENSLSLRYQQEWAFDENKYPSAATDYDIVRQPELTVTLKPITLLDFKLLTDISAGVFQRDLTDQMINSLTGSDQELATQSSRLQSELTLQHSFEHNQNKAFIKTSFNLIGSSYSLTNPTSYSLPDSNIQQLNWLAFIDSGITFKTARSETDSRVDHALSPRVYFAYSPYVEQNAPLLDTTAIDNFELFTQSRFSGLDRIGDMSRFSTSLTYDLSGTQTNNKLLSVGLEKGVKLQQERVTELTNLAIDTNWQPEYSDWLSSLRISPTESLRLTASAALPHHTSTLSTYNVAVDYKPNERVFSHLQFERRIATSDDSTTHRIKTGTYFPVLPNVGVVGYANATSEQLKPNAEDFQISELLLGIDYESCCWNIRFATLQLAADEDNSSALFPVDVQRKYYIEFTLKGIGAGFGTIDTLLTNLDFGYSDRLFNYR